MTSDGLRSIGVLEVEGRLRILRPATLRRPVDGQLDARCRQYCIRRVTVFSQWGGCSQTSARSSLHFPIANP